jgi:hypothetical protein
MKKGRISNEEAFFIEGNVGRLSTEQIAKELDRDPESIEAFIKRKFRVGTSPEEAAAYDLENRPYWKELESQFTKGELELFKYHWARIVSQFKDDVIPTEELQVVDLIKLELLMNRCLKQNKNTLEQIELYENTVREERAAQDQDRENIFSLERQISSLKASQESLNRDYRELQAKKGSMLKEMKATREQRVKRLEDSRQTFTGWVTYLMTNPEVLRQYGVEMEKMRLAAQKERERLGAYHKFVDGDVDRPLLTPESARGDHDT